MTFQIGAMLVGLFLLLVAFNVPIAISLGISTLITMFAFRLPFNMYADVLYTGLDKYTLMAIPYFILSGVILAKSGISQRIVDFAKLLVGRAYGGFAIMSIVVCMFWGAISGSAPATVAALGAVLIPAMIDHNYDKGFASATVSASGGISIIIPPSISMVAYGVLANVSIGDLFLGGVFPGIVMGLMFCTYAWFISKKNNYRTDVPKAGGREIWIAFKRAFPGMMTPVIILGGIYGGIFTPTEAAAVAVAYSLIISLFVYRSVPLKSCVRLFAEAGVTTASVMIILGNAGFFAWLLTSRGIGDAMANALMNLSNSAFVSLMFCTFILCVAGCFIDGMSITYIFVPVMLPVVKHFGYDPLWFGVFVSMAIAVGCITPPVAVNLYPAARIAGITLGYISKRVIGYVVVATLSLVVMILFPQLATFLPGLR